MSVCENHSTETPALQMLCHESHWHVGSMSRENGACIDSRDGR